MWIMEENKITGERERERDFYLSNKNVYNNS